MSESQTELAKKYSPADVESQINERWNAANAYHADPDDGGGPYCIVIPPPNVTAALHMGHALNNTLQDILIRWRRMLGDNTLWMPGTDHAGIATQTVVDKRLKSEGQKSIVDYKQMETDGENGREQFIEKVQAWKDEYEARITHQLKEMGCSCDWDRQRFTMDETCARAVREAFFRMFKDGLIYRGKRLVNWDPVTQTALADDEVENKEIDGHFWYMRYPLLGPPLSDGKNFVTVATTRPETMLGDTAVAVNPKDPRAEELRGRQVLLPIVNREIPIIEDDYVVLPVEHGGDENDSKAQFATGFLKVTPAHDPNDWEIGIRHDLDKINVMAPDGSISKNHGWPEEEWADEAMNDAGFLLGQSREEARDLVVSYFKDHQLLQEVRDYSHSVGHSYRSHVPVEPYLSDQWYVKVTDDRLAGAALRAMADDQRSGTDGCVWKDESSFESKGSDWEGQLRFYPQRYAKTFQMWHENIRDWCISRQLWWGHRIPVWSKVTDTEYNRANAQGLELDSWPEAFAEQGLREDLQGKIAFQSDIHADGTATQYVCVISGNPEIEKEIEAAGFKRDPDVLDTWFSSALWPYSTMGWPDDTSELQTWNPGNLLCTAREIITLWVSRMVMTNLYHLDRLPFTHVFIHAMIQDGEGQKMSKSLGNGVDPLDIIHSHGSDAMRLTLSAMTTQTQDVRMPVEPVCPACSHEFEPKTKRTKAGHVVAAPTQKCPECGKQMVTGFGQASGEATPSDDMPLARNTSEKFDWGRNFANKLWNAVRFALGHLEGSQAMDGELTVPDQWILSRLHATVNETNKALEQYEFSRYANGLYDFIWRDFCDWYIEAAKPTIKDNATQQRVLASCIDAILRLLHPAMPFITEKLWERLNEVAPDRGVEELELPASELLIKAPWPKVADTLANAEAESQFDLTQQMVALIREVRTTAKVAPREKVDLSAKVSQDVADRIAPVQSLIESLTNITITAIGPDVEKADDAAAGVGTLGEVYLHGQLDVESERDRLTKQREQTEKTIKTLEGRLNNKGYTDKAPEKLVQQTRDQLADAKKELEAIDERMKGLG